MVAEEPDPLKGATVVEGKRKSSKSKKELPDFMKKGKSDNDKEESKKPSSKKTKATDVMAKVRAAKKH